MAAMYAVYHGPVGLRHIANKVHGLTNVLKVNVERLGYAVSNKSFFDTVTIDTVGTGISAKAIHEKARAAGINLRNVDESRVGVTFDESVGIEDLVDIINIFASAVSRPSVCASDLVAIKQSSISASMARVSSFLPHPVFNKHHSETEMLRYIHHLQSKDLSLVHTMIPLGSCTMKLNSTSSMIPLTWPAFSNVHPFAPADQVKGYLELIQV
jgi:glycine dehydrogenase